MEEHDRERDNSERDQMSGGDRRMKGIGEREQDEMSRGERNEKKQTTHRKRAWTGNDEGIDEDAGESIEDERLPVTVIVRIIRMVRTLLVCIIFNFVSSVVLWIDRAIRCVMIGRRWRPVGAIAERRRLICA